MIIHFLVTSAVLYTLLTIIFYSVYLKLKQKKHHNEFMNKNICILIAHPDDEVMFFGPIIRSLSKIRNRIFILCMTSGDYYGKGGLRVKEMKASCVNLIGNGKTSNLINLKVVNEPEKLPDHPSRQWDEQLAREIISSYLKANSINTVITFDRFGVSSHANHCILNKLTSDMASDNSPQKLNVYALTTVNRLRKYMFLFDLMPSVLINKFVNRQQFTAVSSPYDFHITLGSMMKHKTQLMWFRWLYLFTSRYMFINTIEKLNI